MKKMPLMKSEKGSVSIVAAILMVAIFALFLAVMSHAQFLSGYSRASEAASNAARIGAQQIDTEHLTETGETKIDTYKARQAVRKYLQEYSSLKMVSLQVNEGRVEVTVSETVTSVSGKKRPVTSTAISEAIVVAD